jgi:hypothetical protein
LAGAGFEPLDVMKNDESNPLLYGRRVALRGGTTVLVYLVGKYGI